MNRYDELLALATEAQALWARLAQMRRCPPALALKAQMRFARRADDLDAYEEDQPLPINDDEGEL